MTKKEVSDVEDRTLCDEIEDKILRDEISRAQVFTQMRQLINSLKKENEDQTNVINSCDGVIKWQNDKILKLEKMIEYGLGKKDLKDEH